MSLHDLLPEYSGKISDFTISSISLDSQEIKKGDLYISLANDSDQQKKYNQEALKKGANCILTNNKSNENIEKKIIYVTDLKEKLGFLSNKFFKNPSKKIEVFGITGTNGKSSVSYYLFQLLSQIKIDNGLISSIKLKESGIYNSKLTTPDVFTLNKILSNFLLEKKKAAIFEVSSHGIDPVSYTHLTLPTTGSV